VKQPDIYEVEIIQPRRPVGQYQLLEDQILRLQEIIYPDTCLPFDLAVLPKTLTLKGESLPVILIGEVSHPPHTRLQAHVIGGVRRAADEFYLIGVPVADERYNWENSPSQLSASVRNQLGERLSQGSEIEWFGKDSVASLILEARGKYHRARMEVIREDTVRPAWLPADRDGRVVGYTEAEHYTDAEYTYFQLPYRFQHYMDQHLAKDERILFALSRPAIKSEVQRTWLGRKQLQEGVVILTDQRLIHLAELIPPDRSGVRYGFQSQVGVLERLCDVRCNPSGDKNLLLRTVWAAAGGSASIEFELPATSGPGIEPLRCFLNRFISDADSSRTLRRIALPEIPEQLPPLQDVAANDPKEVEWINQQFFSLLATSLPASEKAIAWALWPARFEKKGYASVLVVSDRCVRVLPDPKAGAQEIIEIPLQQIGAFDYTASILDSSLSFRWIDSGIPKTTQLRFPYPAEKAFRRCFEAIRRCTAVAHLA
jgi:hypothetical protein